MSSMLLRNAKQSEPEETRGTGAQQREEVPLRPVRPQGRPESSPEDPRRGRPRGEEEVRLRPVRVQEQ